MALHWQGFLQLGASLQMSSPNSIIAKSEILGGIVKAAR
jgi:hypothetical protein